MARAPVPKRRERKNKLLSDRSIASLDFLALTSTSTSLFAFSLNKKNSPAVPQDHHHQEEARARREAEPADPAVDPLPHREQDQVQRQAPPLKAHQARVLERRRRKRRKRGRGRREKERERTFRALSSSFPPLFFYFSFFFARALSIDSV
jgi:type IV secretory pathway VirB10-like protein